MSTDGHLTGQWRREVSCFIPEAVLDQMVEVNGNDVKKLLLNSWQWLQECEDVSYAYISQSTHDQDPLEYLCRSLNIPSTYLKCVRERDADKKQQIIEAVNYYLIQKLDLLKVQTTEEVTWKQEASTFIPDIFLDQMLEIHGNNLGKLFIALLQWLQENKDLAFAHVLRNCGQQDIMEYLSDSLSISSRTLEEVRHRSSDLQQQVFEAVQRYLTQKLGLLLDHENDISHSQTDTGDGNFSGKGRFRGSPYPPSKKRSETTIKACFTNERTEVVPVVQRSQKRIKKFKLPRPAFQQTESYCEVLKCLGAKYGVVHIYGMSGNGKSQIVRAACVQIGKRDDTMIWHVQCADGISLTGELKELVSKLTCMSVDVRDEVFLGIEKGKFQKLISALKGIDIPILIVLEDVGASDRENLQAMMQHLLHDTEDAETNLVQFLIATQKKDSIFTDEDLLAMDGYQTIKITGFTKSEAENFLSTGNLVRGTDHKKSELAEILHYSPLRLTLAKAYCKKYHTSYEHYVESLGKSQKVIDKEKELLKLDHGIAKYHGYEVIMKALEPKDGSKPECEENLQFKVMQMMCFISNEDIPDVLLGRFFQELKTLEVREESNQVRYLLTRLETDCDMMIHEFGKQAEYGEGLSSIHMDIFHAIQLSMGLEERKATAVKVLHALIPLVKKDNRLHTDSDLLFRLMKHIERVITLSSDLLNADFNLKKPIREDFEIQICLSWLYEVLGFVNSEYATMQDALFEKALSWLWDIACSYTGLFHRSGAVTKKGLLNYDDGKDGNTTAHKVYKRIKLASEKIPEGFIKQHYAKFSSMGKSSLDDMKATLGPGVKVDWEKLYQQVTNHRCLTERQMVILQENKMLLTPKQLRKVFLTERISSILHSRGRQGLKEDSPNEKQYEWYAAVGLKLTQIMSKDTGVKTTFEYIIAANNVLPHLLQNQENETDEKFVARLENVKYKAESLKQASGHYYEHGVYKTMSGTPYSILNAMKYIVRANTRYYERPHLVPDDSTTALKECDDFFQLAKDTVAMFVVASCCMIYAGKYYAVCGKFSEALDACEAGFDHNGHGINSLVQSRPKLYAWAVYNIGRAILKSGSVTPGGQKHRQKYHLRCDNLLHADISRDMRSKLDECRAKLDAIEFP